MKRVCVLFFNNKLIVTFRDKQKPIYENLLETFQLVADEQQRSTDYTKTGDIECGICYSYKLNGVETPDTICANAQCNRGFHYPCLYQVRLHFYFCLSSLG